MSSPPQQRALTFPLVWSKNHARAGAAEVLQAPSPTDEDLLLRLRQKEQAALHLLFDRYSRIVLTIALGILRDYGEAEDVVQESFIYFYKRADAFDPSKGTARGWITQTAYHRALDRKLYLRRRGFYAGTEIEAFRDKLPSDIDLDRSLGRKLNQELLGKAVGKLPEMQRKTIEMYYFEGMELREISEALEESWGAVRHHFYRGLQQLRRSSFVRKLRDE